MYLYLSGKMGGVEDLNCPYFDEVAASLRDEGHTVWNPAELFDGNTTLPRHIYLKEDLKMLVKEPFDGIVLLDDWQESHGSLLEIMIARELHFAMFDEDLNDITVEIDEFLSVAKPAVSGIALTMTEDVNLDKYELYTWVHQSWLSHVLRGARHLMSASIFHEMPKKAEGEDHVAQAMCRSAMAYAKQFFSE